MFDVFCIRIIGCLANEFRCANKCIDLLNRCDRHADCEDEEDEMHCGEILIFDFSQVACILT